jgi:hypothetical protein
MALEQEIIGLYDSNLVNLFSINQIARSLKKTYPFINKKVTELLDSSILRKTVVGKSYLCSLNLDNELTAILLAKHEIAKREGSIEAKPVQDFISGTRLRITVHCVLSSPAGLVFVIENLKDRREIQRVFPSATIVDREEFLDLIVDDELLYSQHAVLYGMERFIELVRMRLPELKAKHSPLRY